MSRLGGKTREDTAGPIDPAPVFLDARSEFAARFLAGEGLEIGALHQPLATPPQATSRYVDRLSVDDLRSEYPELADWNLTDVDVIDNGELLETVAEESQDFIIANHFLEHCQDPIGTIANHLGKLRPGGVLFYTVPDKRYTFDFRRPITSLSHMVDDHEQGPECSRREHYDEAALLCPDFEPGTDPEEFERWAARQARELEAEASSIHMHVWTQAEFLQLVIHCRARFGNAFDIEAAVKIAGEFVVVLRKQSA
jgi:SAM-dependent methyltransferase